MKQHYMVNQDTRNWSPRLVAAAGVFEEILVRGLPYWHYQPALWPATILWGLSHLAYLRNLHTSLRKKTLLINAPILGFASFILAWLWLNNLWFLALAIHGGFNYILHKIIAWHRIKPVEIPAEFFE